MQAFLMKSVQTRTAMFLLATKSSCHKS